MGVMMARTGLEQFAQSQRNRTVLKKCAFDHPILRVIRLDKVNVGHQLGAAIAFLVRQVQHQRPPVNNLPLPSQQGLIKHGYNPDPVPRKVPRPNTYPACFVRRIRLSRCLGNHGQTRDKLARAVRSSHLGGSLTICGNDLQVTELTPTPCFHAQLASGDLNPGTVHENHLTAPGRSQ